MVGVDTPAVGGTPDSGVGTQPGEAAGEGTQAVVEGIQAVVGDTPLPWVEAGRGNQRAGHPAEGRLDFEEVGRQPEMS